MQYWVHIFVLGDKWTASIKQKLSSAKCFFRYSILFQLLVLEKIPLNKDTPHVIYWCGCFLLEITDLYRIIVIALNSHTAGGVNQCFSGKYLLWNLRQNFRKITTVILPEFVCQWSYLPDMYSELRQTSKMERFPQNTPCLTGSWIRFCLLLDNNSKGK